MRERLRANGNTATLYDVNIHAHTLSRIVCMRYALRVVQRLSNS